MKTPSTSTILVILGALIWSSAGSLAGCLSTQLKAPVMDHSVQLHVIADRCKGKGKCPTLRHRAAPNSKLTSMRLPNRLS